MDILYSIYYWWINIYFYSFLFRRLDYCGIIMMIVASFTPWLYYGFYCRTTPAILYQVSVSGFGIACSVFALKDKFSLPEYRLIRAGRHNFVSQSYNFGRPGDSWQEKARLEWGEGIRTFFAHLDWPCIILSKMSPYSCWIYWQMWTFHFRQDYGRCQK